MRGDEPKTYYCAFCGKSFNEVQKASSYRCEPCAQIAARAVSHKTRAGRVAKGLCIECCKPREDENKIRCKACRIRASARSLAWYHNNK